MWHTVEEVTSHAQSVKTSAEQMEQVVDESSRAIQTVSEKLNTAKEQIDKNYDYAPAAGAELCRSDTGSQ